MSGRRANFSSEWVKVRMWMWNGCECGWMCENVNMKWCACEEFDYLISEFESASRISHLESLVSNLASLAAGAFLLSSGDFMAPSICATASAFLCVWGCAVYLFNLCVSDSVHCTCHPLRPNPFPTKTQHDIALSFAFRRPCNQLLTFIVAWH